MEIVMLTVPDCPNGPVLEERLSQALAQLGSQASIVRRTVENEEQAAQWGMRGSPTLLVNGVDPLADPAVPTSMSCRMYRDAEGRYQGAPSVAALREALRVKVWSGPLARAGAGRLAPIEGGLRAVHQQVLRFFADHGRAPRPAELGAQAEQVLAELHEGDYLRLDKDGGIQAAYPFSATPTTHQVRIGGGPRVFAMCAIDALGMGAMLGRDIRIDSMDPVTGQRIAVQLPADVWEPEAVVVFAGQQESDLECCAAAEVCCGYVNFFADRSSAQAWADNHPTVVGQILEQEEALRLGVAIFGPLLDNG